MGLSPSGVSCKLRVFARSSDDSRKTNLGYWLNTGLLAAALHDTPAGTPFCPKTRWGCVQVPFPVPIGLKIDQSHA